MDKKVLLLHYRLLIAPVVWGICSAFIFIKKQTRKLDYEHGNMPTDQYNLIIFPAVAANQLYTFLFGEVKSLKFKKLFTYRSIGRPPVLPLALAAANPACVRSLIRLRSNSASAPKI